MLDFLHVAELREFIEKESNGRQVPLVPRIPNGNLPEQGADERAVRDEFFRSDAQVERTVVAAEVPEIDGRLRDDRFKLRRTPDFDVPQDGVVEVRAGWPV